MNRKIIFYRTIDNKCPVEDFLNSLTDKQAIKVTWVLRIVRDLDPVPSIYFKKLINTDNIWEIRIQIGGDIFRFLGFYDDLNLFILTNGFHKKTRKIPQQEIKIAEERKRDYLKRRKK